MFSADPGVFIFLGERERERVVDGGLPGGDCTTLMSLSRPIDTKWVLLFLGFAAGASGKEPACQCRRCETWVRSLGWEDPLKEGAQQPTPAFLSGESHGQRSLAGYSPLGCKGSDPTRMHRAFVSHRRIFLKAPLSLVEENSLLLHVEGLNRRQTPCEGLTGDGRGAQRAALSVGCPRMGQELSHSGPRGWDDDTLWSCPLKPPHFRL